MPPKKEPAKADGATKTLDDDHSKSLSRLINVNSGVHLHLPPRHGPFFEECERSSEEGATGTCSTSEVPCWVCERGAGRQPAHSGSDLPPAECGCEENRCFAHVECLIDRARRMNEENFANESLRKDYESFRDAFDKPWITCGNCGKDYRSSLVAQLSKEYVKSNIDLSDERNIRRTIATIRLGFVEDQILGNHQKSYRLFQRLSDSFRTYADAEKRKCSKDDGLFWRFKDGLENDIRQGLAVSEFSLPKRTAPKPADACCWICLDEGADPDNIALMRDCACRGDAGFVHVACIRDYAQDKNNILFRELLKGLSFTPDKIQDPWIKCPNCIQSYQGQLAVEIAKAFVSVYQCLPYFDIRHSSSLDTLAMAYMLKCDYDSAISVLKQQLEEVRSVPPNLGDVGHEVGKLLSCLYCAYKQKGDAKNRDECLKKMREMGATHVAVEGSPQPLVSIDQLLNQRETGPDESVDNARTVLEVMKKKCGPNARETLDASFRLSQALLMKRNMREALSILCTVIVDAKRILGHDHAQTQEYERWGVLMMKGMSTRQELTEEERLIQPRTDAKLISENSKLNGRKAKAVKYTQDRKKIIIDLEQTSGGQPQRFKVFPSQLAFDAGTNVIMPGGKLGIVLSFDEENKMYTLGAWGGNFSSTRCKQEDVVIYFESFNI